MVAYGTYPSWLSSVNSIHYLTRAINSLGQSIGDTLWRFNISLNEKQPVVFFNGSNRNIKYLKNTGRIVYCSDGNLWMMDSTGNNQRKLTFETVDNDFGVPFSCSWVDDKIVYTKYNPNNWTYENGTLWTLDLMTGEKKQLTFNPKPAN